MSVWSSYVKMIDRRLTRYGEKEQYMDEAQREIDEAAVFDFLSNEIGLSTQIKDIKMDEFNRTLRERLRQKFDPEKFFLPFETCAVEVQMAKDLRVMCLMERPEGHEVGFGDGEHKWPVMVATTLEDEPNVLRLVKLVISGPVNFGMRDAHSSMKCFMFSICEFNVGTGKCLTSWRHDFPEEQTGIDPKMLDMCKQECCAFALHAMELVTKANSPANWVVRVTDEHARIVKRRGKKVKKKNKRLIVVPDRDLDKLLRQSNDASDFIEKAPHRRRAHFRRLLSKRYRLKRGKRVFVKESWVGPKSAIFNGEVYEVLTSLPSQDRSD